MKRSAWWPFAAAISGLSLAGCAGGTTDPPPPPPPPPPPVAVTLDMALGDLVTLDAAAEVRAFRLASGGESRDYEMVIASASEVAGASTDMRLVVRADGAASNVVPVRGEPLAAPSRPPARELRLRASSFATERLLRQRDYDELVRVGARPIRPGLDVSASIAAGQPPQLGQVMTFRIGVDSNLTVDCNNTTVITGEVKYAGQHFTVVEDIQIGQQPAAERLTDADFQEIGQQLDNVVYPIDVAYFGTEADIDNNGTVIALVTAEVNRLTPAGSGSIVAGFFLARDLTSASQCAASNEGEIFYLVGPDPDNDFGATISIDFANTLARTTVAHEFLHLLGTQQRVTIGGGDLVTSRDDAWLDEGLAHLAEEVAGLSAGGFGTRANLDLAQITLTQTQLDAYNDFHRLNHDRLGRFFKGGCPVSNPAGPAAALALGDGFGFDPGGNESLSFRGFGYGFVRWLGDQFGPSGAGGALAGSREEMLFRELSSGGPNQAVGIANVERAIQTVAGSSMQWQELVSLYLASIVSDDNAPPGTDPRTQWSTWDLRDLYGQLSQSNLGDSCPFNSAYPLAPARVTLGPTINQSLDFAVNASTGRFVSLTSSGPAPDVTIEVTTGAGAGLPSGARGQVTILRTR